jgi:hypothetical protein
MPGILFNICCGIGEHIYISPLYSLEGCTFAAATTSMIFQWVIIVIIRTKDAHFSTTIHMHQTSHMDIVTISKQVIGNGKGRFCFGINAKNVKRTMAMVSNKVPKLSDYKTVDEFLGSKAVWQETSKYQNITDRERQIIDFALYFINDIEQRRKTHHA